MRRSEQRRAVCNCPALQRSRAPHAAGRAVRERRSQYFCTVMMQTVRPYSALQCRSFTAVLLRHLFCLSFGKQPACAVTSK